MRKPATQEAGTQAEISASNDQYSETLEAEAEEADEEDIIMSEENTVIGLLGGGQLGRMLCEAANPLGIDIAILDEENAPAKQAHNTNRHVAGSFKDAARIKELAAVSDYLSVEIEHVDTEVLEEIEKNGVEVQTEEGTVIHRPPIHPSWRTIRLIQDKYLQKEHFSSSGKGIPIAEQVAIGSGDATLDSLKKAGKKFGFPFMLKARKGSYDGRGNFKINSEADFSEAIKALGTLPLYAEKWAPFVKELSVMVIRTEEDDGTLKGCVAYPAVETIHEESICTKVFMPPRGVSEEIAEAARKLATEVIKTVWGRGVFAVEMFVLEDGSLMVNEVAPRPHNSGHHTIEAVPYMSQFKAQLYAVLDLPVPDKLTPRVKSAIMLNILGGAKPESHHELSKLARGTYGDDFDVYLHLYGKASKPGRKIGHITITGSCSIKELEAKSKKLIDMVDQIRLDRIQAALETLRPTQESAPAVNGSKSPEGPEPVPKTIRAGDKIENRAELEPKPLTEESKPLVLVTMGSDSDLPVLKAGLDILREFNVPYTLDITSAHRTPKYMMKVADEAAGKGIKVIIAAAGGAAHLPGMISSETPLPVIGVPVKATHLDGIDSLLSIVQMPVSFYHPS